MPNDQFKSARLKLARASTHIANIHRKLKDERPFKYILETNAMSGQRSTYAQRDEKVIDEISLICGDAIQNLCAGIDHAYTAVVAPHAKTEKEKRNIQFPFSETAGRLKEACPNRLAHRVGEGFRDAIMELGPHGEAGGNEILYFMSILNNPDKHAALVPTGYYLEMRVGEMRKQVPDFLPGLNEDFLLGVGQNGRDFVWTRHPFSMHEWILKRVPANGILIEELMVPVNLTFEARLSGGQTLVSDTLDRFVDTANAVVEKYFSIRVKFKVMFVVHISGNVLICLGRFGPFSWFTWLIFTWENGIIGGSCGGTIRFNGLDDRLVLGRFMMVLPRLCPGFSTY